MISKVFITGQSFGETSKYICMDLERAEVLAVEGVRPDYAGMEVDFKSNHRLLPEKEKPVFHGMLSFPPGENPGNEKMVEIARRYLEEIGMVNTQYAIVKHTDRAHLHLHIMANRVDYEGRIIGKGLIAERGMRAAQKLTREYGLRAEKGKHLEQTNRVAMRPQDARRYQLYEAIRDELPGCRQIEDLEKRLLEKGIVTRYRVDGETGKRCGISFRIGNYAFRGSQVDEQFSYGKLERTLRMQRELAMWQELRPGAELKQGGELKQAPGLKKEARQEEEHRLQHSLRRGRGR